VLRQFPTPAPAGATEHPHKLPDLLVKEHLRTPLSPGKTLHSRPNREGVKGFPRIHFRFGPTALLHHADEPAQVEPLRQPPPDTRHPLAGFLPCSQPAASLDRPRMVEVHGGCRRLRKSPLVEL